MSSDATTEVTAQPVPEQPTSVFRSAAHDTDPGNDVLDLPAGVTPQVAADVVDWLAGWVSRKQQHGLTLPTVTDLYGLADDLRNWS